MKNDILRLWATTLTMGLLALSPALAADPEVDVVYVATPHPLHKGNAILCLEAGKAVLCEKPFPIKRPEGEEVAA